MAARLFSRPWGFDVASIRATVRFWHGTVDESVPIAAARSLARAIPGATLEVIEGAGHFLFFDHFRAILSWAVDGA